MESSQFQDFNSSPLECCSLFRNSVHETSKIRAAFPKTPLCSQGVSMRSKHSDCGKCDHKSGQKWPVGTQ